MKSANDGLAKELHESKSGVVKLEAQRNESKREIGDMKGYVCKTKRCGDEAGRKESTCKTSWESADLSQGKADEIG